MRMLTDVAPDPGVLSAAPGKAGRSPVRKEPVTAPPGQVYLRINAVQTGGGTNFDTSPPSRAISLTSFEAIA